MTKETKRCTFAGSHLVETALILREFLRNPIELHKQEGID